MGNPVVHWELMSKDPVKVADFYAKLFGWKVEHQPEMNYRIVRTGGDVGRAQSPCCAHEYVRTNVESGSAMTVVTRPAGKRIRVTVAGEVIADTRDAVALEEGAYPVVFYIPRKDVKMERLARTSRRTHCPHKGDASYYSLVGGPANAAWSYEQPLDAVKSIKDLLAFYPDKVDAIAAG